MTFYHCSQEVIPRCKYFKYELKQMLTNFRKRFAFNQEPPMAVKWPQHSPNKVTTQHFIAGGPGTLSTTTKTNHNQPTTNPQPTTTNHNQHNKPTSICLRLFFLFYYFPCWNLSLLDFSFFQGASENANGSQGFLARSFSALWSGRRPCLLLPLAGRTLVSPSASPCSWRTSCSCRLMDAPSIPPGVAHGYELSGTTSKWVDMKPHKMMSTKGAPINIHTQVGGTPK